MPHGFLAALKGCEATRHPGKASGSSPQSSGNTLRHFFQPHACSLTTGYPSASDEPDCLFCPRFRDEKP